MTFSEAVKKAMSGKKVTCDLLKKMYMSEHKGDLCIFHLNGTQIDGKTANISQMCDEWYEQGTSAFERNNSENRRKHFDKLFIMLTGEEPKVHHYSETARFIREMYEKETRVKGSE